MRSSSGKPLRVGLVALAIMIWGLCCQNVGEPAFRGVDIVEIFHEESDKEAKFRVCRFRGLVSKLIHATYHVILCSLINLVSPTGGVVK
jgi:hypothetical protein